MKSYTSGQLHEIKDCVRGPVNTVSVPVYRLLKCLGIVNCRIRPTRRGTKCVKKRHIPVVVTVLRPPKPHVLLSVNSSNELMFTITCIRRQIKLIVLYCIVPGLNNDRR